MLKDPPDQFPDGSQPAMPASSIMAAMIAEQAESRTLCAVLASSIVSGAGSTCGSRGAIAAAFDDLATMDPVGELLRGREGRGDKTC